MTVSQIVAVISIIVTVVVDGGREATLVSSSEVINLRNSGYKSQDRPSSCLPLLTFELRNQNFSNNVN